MLIFSEEMRCVDDVATVVACLSMPTIFYRPREREEESDASREKFFATESDHLTLLNVYLQWKKNGYRGEWCTRHFIHAKAMRKVKEVRQQILDICAQLKMRVESCGTEWDVCRQAVASTYFSNAAKMKTVAEYVNMRSGMPCTSTELGAFGMGYGPTTSMPRLVMTAKEYMQCVTVDQWLPRRRCSSRQAAGRDARREAREGEAHKAKMEEEMAAYEEAKKAKAAASATLRPATPKARAARSRPPAAAATRSGRRRAGGRRGLEYGQNSTL